ncbi:MAG: DUF1835 domain-containing protein [Oscillospiraceae bacterium]|nr:DUF1835 domain-containing protein [Oscillospiraceae bacterium]
MLEILFTESAAGGLKVARHYGKGPYRPKNIRFLPTADGTPLSRQEMDAHRKAAEEKERINWEKAVLMDIDSRDVVALPFALSTGDVSEDYPSEKRLKYFDQLMSIYPDFNDNKETEKWFGKMQASLDRVLKAVKDNQPVRLWYSDNPDELCGLYHIVYLIDKFNPQAEIHTVKLPAQYIREDGSVISYNGWGDVSPREWHIHFKTEKMTRSVKTLCLTNWCRLKADNAPVRAMLNGLMHSLPEDIYDSFIIKEIQQMDTQFRQALVIGSVLGKYQLCIGDAFIAYRMEKMIDSGMLTVVQPSEKGSPLYHRTVKRNI